METSSFSRACSPTPRPEHRGFPSQNSGSVSTASSVVIRPASCKSPLRLPLTPSAHLARRVQLVPTGPFTLRTSVSCRPAIKHFQLPCSHPEMQLPSAHSETRHAGLPSLMHPLTPTPCKGYPKGIVPGRVISNLAAPWPSGYTADTICPFFFPAPFCHCKLKRVQVPVPTAAYAASHASRTGREAAGLRSLLPASVCQELVQSWRRASSSKLRLEG